MLEIEANTSQILVRKLAEQSQKYLYSGDEDGLKYLLGRYKKLPHILETQLFYKNNHYFVNGENIPLNYQSEKRRYRGSELILINQQLAFKTSTTLIFRPTKIIGMPNKNTLLTSDLKVKVTILLSLEHVGDKVIQMVRKSIGIILTILIGGLVIGWKISSSLISPLKNLAEQTEADSDTDDHKPDEIEQISNHLIALKLNIKKKHEIITNAQIVSANLATKNKNLNALIKIKNDFVFQISHEIKTPLTSIAMHLENLKTESLGKLNTKQKDRLKRVSQISARLSRLVEPLIGFAIRENSHLATLGKEIDLMSSAKQIVFSLESQEQDYQVRIFLDTSLKEYKIFANPDHVEQVLLNLIHNAIKASPPGSMVAVRASEYNKTHIKIFIEDRGFGIDKQLSKKLFIEPIKNNLSESSVNGIGLYICKFLVEMNRGIIWFETNELQGTTFSFTLPKIYPIIILKEDSDASQSTYSR